MRKNHENLWDNRRHVQGGGGGGISAGDISAPPNLGALGFGTCPTVSKGLALVAQKISQGKFRHQSKSRNFPLPKSPPQYSCMRPSAKFRPLRHHRPLVPDSMAEDTCSRTPAQT